jgi:sugar phosphate isomerase/epimerase
LTHLAELSPILGCSAVRIFSYYNKDACPDSEFHDVAISRLVSLRDLAKELGMVLYHENERHIYGDFASGVAMIGKEVRDGSTFRTIFDFDNYTQGGQNAWDVWQMVKGDVDGIHLKDSVNRQQVPVGTGEGFVERILRDALAENWEGPLSVEPHLSHSGAVAATGPSGIENQSFKDMTDSQRFVLACNAATALLKRIGAPVE